MIEASGLVLALTTETNAERAQQLAEALLERHLVACVEDVSSLMDRLERD